MAKVSDTQPSRRAIVLMTDGEDNRSNIGLQDAINAALHADAVVYVLSTNPELSISLAQEGDKQRQINIAVGIVGEEQVEVIAGLEAGQAVVTGGK